MFIDHKGRNVMQIERIAGAGHVQGVGGGLRFGHAVEQHSHTPGAGLIIGNIAPGVPFDKEFQFLAGQLQPVSLFGNDVYGSYGGLLFASLRQMRNTYLPTCLLGYSPK